jgi:hypothetical protein
MPDPIHHAMTTLAEITAAYCAAFKDRIYAKSMELFDALLIKLNPTNAHPTYFGRKRRARRARGRRIEARRAYSSAALTWRIAPEAESRRLLATFVNPSPGEPKWGRLLEACGFTEVLPTITNPSPGVQWGEITGDGSGEALPPIPDA